MSRLALPGGLLLPNWRAIDNLSESGGTYAINSYGSAGATGEWVSSPALYSRAAKLKPPTGGGKWASLDRKSIPSPLPKFTANSRIGVALRYTSIPQLDSSKAACRLCLWFSTTNFATSDCSTAVIPQYLSAESVDGWRFVSALASDFSCNGGDAITSSHTSWLLRFYDDAGDGAGEVLVGGLFLDLGTRTKVMIEFDDAFESIYDNARSVVSSAGIPAGLAVYESVIGTAGYCTTAELLTLQSEGWHFLTHGHNQQYTYASQLQSATQERNYLRSLGLIGNEDHYVYPGGAWVLGQNAEALMDAGFLSARTTHGGPLVARNAGSPDMWARAYTLSQSTGLTNLKAFLDSAIRRGQSIRFYGHKVVGSVSDASMELSTADFTSFVAYVKQKQDAGLCDVVTPAEYYAGLSGARIDLQTGRVGG